MRDGVDPLNVILGPGQPLIGIVWIFGNAQERVDFDPANFSAVLEYRLADSQEIVASWFLVLERGLHADDIWLFKTLNQDGASALVKAVEIVVVFFCVEPAHRLVKLSLARYSLISSPIVRRLTLTVASPLRHLAYCAQNSALD